MFLFLLLCCLVLSVNSQDLDDGESRCYDDNHKPQRCIPEFVNAAYQLPVEATNTCGVSRPIEFCLQTGATGSKKSCEICDAHSPYYSHNPEYLTDFNNNDNQTWWQSETMLEDIQYPNEVNLTLYLKKAFDITYVRLKFYSPRPESFAIFKRTSENGSWIPYQYYSATCRDTYSLPDSTYLRRGDESTYLRHGDETRALCISEFSDISPLTGGNVAFSTLEGRPSAYNFEKSAELQEWVTATDIRIQLNRLNTFGDEVFGDPKVLKSYFYAISDFAVGGRCKCNGHASDCVHSTSLHGERVLVCRCEHNTAGPDCNECLPFYNDVPWGPATADDANECKACNCNGYANRCYFDKDLFEQTGHGGHCLDCQGNRAGPHCERCRDDFYMREDGICIPCHCNEIGSFTLQCGRQGQCQCKPGVTGDKCDRCENNFYDFSSQGCKPCSCNPDGSYRNQPRCDPVEGRCQCKENVEGQRCDRCKPGYFNLNKDNMFGCTPCFCYGHSSVCRSATGYSTSVVESIFSRGDERWTAQEATGRQVPLQYSAVVQNIGISSPTRNAVYFIAPKKFLGDQRASYNHDLKFTLRIADSGPQAVYDDIVLEGAGLKVSQPIFGQENPLPSLTNQEYKFRLHEHSQYGWSPRLSARDFISLLADLKSIKIRGTFTSGGTGYLDDVKLETAVRVAGLGLPVSWIEMCTCPEGYVGQFCESCAPGYRHDPANGGPFARCVPCDCNGHADICDADTGRCICQHNTAGDNCERCARGFYGNALTGTPTDCQACPCPEQSSCLQMPDGTVVCLECPEGYTGPRCNLCSDGYFGDAAGKFGAPRPCTKCNCNDNIDPNAVGNCNTTTGECLKCIYNTGGSNCDRCLPGYYGDALAIPKGNCIECSCYPLGTVTVGDGSPACDQYTGQCKCKPFITGKNCNKCENGYWNINSGEGCSACNCDLVGSFNQTCDTYTGQCHCRPGVIGQRCDVCAPYHYGFSYSGCKPCECDHIGSTSLQCDPLGQCPCRENVEGRRCDRCKENKYNRQAGCVDCPDCYNLVQDAVNIHRDKLEELEVLLNNIASNPNIINDEEFVKKLAEVVDRVDELWTDAKQRELEGGGDKSLVEQLNELMDRLHNVESVLGKVDGLTDEVRVLEKQAARNVSEAEQYISRAKEAIKDAQYYLDVQGRSALQDAIARSEEFGIQNEKMSEISREARNLANLHEQEANEIETTANEALNFSSQAYNLAQDALEQQRNTTYSISLLKRGIGQVESLMERTQSEAERVQQRAQKAQDDAVNTHTEAEFLLIPTVDEIALKERAEEITEAAQKIKDEADLLMHNNTGMFEDLDRQIFEMRNLLEAGIRLRQTCEELLADVDLQYSKADKAVMLGDKTLADAQATLKTLQEFDKNVQDSKYKAIEALEKIPEIEQQIFDVENKTRQAQHALAGASQDAQQARDSAQQAQEIAEEASKSADNIRAEVGKTKERAGGLKDEADDLSVKVADTAARLQEFQKHAESDESEAKNAQQKADQAKVTAGRASSEVDQALQKVAKILLELEDHEDIDNARLDELERRLDSVEQQYRESSLEIEVKQLTEARNAQDKLVKSYEDELEFLRREVDNIQAIRDALPDGCWKRVKLEP